MRFLMLLLMILLKFFWLILKLTFSQTGNKKLEILYNSYNSLLLVKAKKNRIIYHYKLYYQNFKALNKNKILLKDSKKNNQKMIKHKTRKN